MLNTFRLNIDFTHSSAIFQEWVFLHGWFAILARRAFCKSIIRDLQFVDGEASPAANISNEINVNNPFGSDETKCCIGGVDFVTLIFTLSASPLDRMPMASTQCFNVLKPGSLLLLRDYGLYDMTMLRF